MKSSIKFVENLRVLTEIIAIGLCLILIATSGFITYQACLSLLSGDPSKAITDSLFVVLLLELFYVIRTFIKRGNMNVGLIINVGVIAAVKELIFKLGSLTLQLGTAFAVVFLSLGLIYVLEMIYYYKKKRNSAVALY